MRGKKCLLFVLLFAVLSTVSFTAFSNEALASYTPNIPTDWNVCLGKMNEKIFSDESGVEKELTFLQAAHDNNPELYNKFRQKTHYIITETGTGGSTITVTAMNADTLQFYRVSTLPNRWNARFVNSESSVEYISMQKSGSSGYVGISQGNVVGTEFNGTIGGNTSRVCYAKGYEYISPWPALEQKEIPEVSTKIEVPNPVKDCTPLDFACWISKAFTGFTDTLEGLGTAILQGIAFLFSPDTDTFQYSFDELKTFLFKKLGFLTYPIAWTIDTFNGMVSRATTDNAWGVGICSLTSSSLPAIPGLGEPEIFGIKPSPDTWFCNVPGYIWASAQWFFRISITLAMLYMFNKRLHEVIGGRA